MSDLNKSEPEQHDSPKRIVTKELTITINRRSIDEEHEKLERFYKELKSIKETAEIIGAEISVYQERLEKANRLALELKDRLAEARQTMYDMAPAGKLNLKLLLVTGPEDVPHHILDND